MKFRKLPVEIEATQWFKDGDHQAVRPCDLQIGYLEGIGPYGWLPTLEGGHIVTPGDWIITGVKGEMYPCKPDIFALTYEPAGRAQRHDGDKQLSRKHDFVRSTLAHHGINNVHTALVADLIHGLDDLRQVGQETVGVATVIEALQFAEAIDPLTRKAAPDHLTMACAAKALRDLAGPQRAPVPLTIVKDVRDGNFQEFRVNGHSGFIRVVARMEDDDEDLPLGKLVERFLLSTQEPLGQSEQDTITPEELLTISESDFDDYFSKNASKIARSHPSRLVRQLAARLVAKDAEMGDYGLIVACEVEDIVTARLTACRPQTPVPLTVEQIPHMGATGDKFYDSVVDMWVNTTCRQDEIDFARVIEAAHNIQAVTP